MWPSALKTHGNYIKQSSLNVSRPKTSCAVLLNIKKNVKTKSTVGTRLYKSFMISSTIPHFSKPARNIEVEVIGSFRKSYTVLESTPDMALVEKHQLYHRSNLETFQSPEAFSGIWSERKARRLAQDSYEEVLRVSGALTEDDDNVKLLLNELVCFLESQNSQNILNNVTCFPLKMLPFSSAKVSVVRNSETRVKPVLPRNRESTPVSNEMKLIPKRALAKWNCKNNFPSSLKLSDFSQFKSILFEKVKEAFGRRPIWTAEALSRDLDIENMKFIKKCIPHLALSCTSGPFSSCFIRYGYNPLKNKLSRIYQIISFEGAKPLTIADYFRKFNTPLLLNCYQVSQKMRIQLCDIEDASVRKLIKFKRVGNKFDSAYGWFHKHDLSAIRRRAKELILEQSGSRHPLKVTAAKWSVENWTNGETLPANEPGFDRVALKPLFKYKPSRAKNKLLSKQDRLQGIRPNKRRKKLEAALDSWKVSSPSKSSKSKKDRMAILSPTRLGLQYESMQTNRQLSLKMKKLSKAARLWRNSKESRLGLESRLHPLRLEKMYRGESFSDSDSEPDNNKLEEKEIINFDIPKAVPLPPLPEPVQIAESRTVEDPVESYFNAEAFERAFSNRDEVEEDVMEDAEEFDLFDNESLASEGNYK